MTDTINQVRVALETLQSREALSLIESTLINKDGAPLLIQPHLAPDVALMISADLCGHLAALSHPAPDVPSADEVEAIRARDKAYDDDRAWEDRRTLLRLLDAARAELAEERAKGWQDISTAPKGVWLPCFRLSLTHPAGFWTAALIYEDGHWIDTRGNAFEPSHHFPTPPKGFE